MTIVSEQHKDKAALIPHPQNVRFGDGEADFSRLAPRVRVVVPKGGPGDLALAAEALARAIHQSSGWIVETYPILDLLAPADMAECFAISINENLEGSLGREGYRLTVNDGALIEACSAPGLFYGIQTLRQLLTFQDGKLTVPKCNIEDRPAWGWRGIMLDQGRNYQSLEFLKRQIDVASQYKLNIFHFHPTEYPGWRVEIKAFPRLKSEKYYTQDELRELVEYAQARFVTIIPEIEMPGHCTAFLDLMPHLKCTNDTMCMGSEELYSTLETILTEVADIFPSPVLHIGTDECEGGQDCPKCQAKWKEISQQPNHPPTLMAYFIDRINRIVRKLGRTTMTWNDQMDHGLPQDIIVHSWKPGSDTPAIARAGYKTVNSRAPEVYFDNGLLPEFVEHIYNWSPNEDQPMPIPNILGGHGEAWHDPPIQNEEEILEDLGFYPRLLTLAERVWTGPGGRERPFEEYKQRLLQHKQCYFAGQSFPYPQQQPNWWERYKGWTTDRGVWKPPAEQTG